MNEKCSWNVKHRREKFLLTINCRKTNFVFCFFQFLHSTHTFFSLFFYLFFFFTYIYFKFRCVFLWNCSWHHECSVKENWRWLWVTNGSKLFRSLPFDTLAVAAVKSCWYRTMLHSYCECKLMCLYMWRD